MQMDFSISSQYYGIAEKIIMAQWKKKAPQKEINLLWLNPFMLSIISLVACFEIQATIVYHQLWSFYEHFFANA